MRALVFGVLFLLCSCSSMGPSVTERFANQAKEYSHLSRKNRVECSLTLKWADYRDAALRQLDGKINWGKMGEAWRWTVSGSRCAIETPSIWKQQLDRDSQLGQELKATQVRVEAALCRLLRPFYFYSPFEQLNIAEVKAGEGDEILVQAKEGGSVSLSHEGREIRTQGLGGLLTARYTRTSLGLLPQEIEMGASSRMLILRNLNYDSISGRAVPRDGELAWGATLDEARLELNLKFTECRLR